MKFFCEYCFEGLRPKVGACSTCFLAAFLPFCKHLPPQTYKFIGLWSVPASNMWRHVVLSSSYDVISYCAGVGEFLLMFIAEFLLSTHFGMLCLQTVRYKLRINILSHHVAPWRLRRFRVPGQVRRRSWWLGRPVDGVKRCPRAANQHPSIN